MFYSSADERGGGRNGALPKWAVRGGRSIKGNTRRRNVIVGGNRNGHLGISREGIERIHGWGVGEKNGEGERFCDGSSTDGI